MSAPRLHADDFLSAKGTLVDVRSPSEFIEGHIPGAVNIALFTDKERAHVGTLYKQQSREAAIDAGFEIAGPKMKQFATRARAAGAEDGLRVYCWRGGMRSGHMSWLFETAGVQTTVLDGGYKSYRQLMMDSFSCINKLVVLQGATGSGKTDVLLQMREMGEQVIDLEGLANHRGSAFGSLGMLPQPSTQLFQNRIYEQLRDFDLGRRIWVEGESKTIGRVYLPDPLWEKMNDTQLVEMIVPKSHRVHRLVRDYGHFSAKELIDSIERLERRLGGGKVQELSTLINTGRIAETASQLLDYYDKSYRYSKEKYKRTSARSVDCTDINERDSASILIKTADQWGL